MRETSTEASFTGVRPLVVPFDRTLRLLSARSCEKPFMAPEVIISTTNIFTVKTATEMSDLNII
jgi:hypothetical protein